MLNSPFRKAEEAIITFNFETITVPTAMYEISYHIKEDIERLVNSFTYLGVKGFPQLSVCGIRFILTELCTEYKYYKGLNGETYPGSMSYRENGELQFQEMMTLLIFFHKNSKFVNIAFSD